MFSQVINCGGLRSKNSIIFDKKMKFSGEILLVGRECRSDVSTLENEDSMMNDATRR